MKRILIFYYSRTGNTERMAKAINEEIKSHQGIEVELRYQIAPDELKNYDAIVFGAPTYHRRMTQTISDLLLEAAIQKINLKNKIGAAFGSYGWSGEAPSRVLEVLENIFQMKVIKSPLLIKYTPKQDSLEKCKEFGKKIVKQLMHSS